MNKSHLNIIIPQWQGGGQDLSTYHGGMQIKSHYFNGSNYEEVPVSIENVSRVENNILGYKEIYQQVIEAKERISNNNPKTIFTVGGGCDADMMSIAYLNEKASGDLTVLYLDAHGDLNTPESSKSKYFYGMPLRTLLNEGEAGLTNLLPSTLLPSQVVMLGVRDLDNEEAQFLRKHDVSVLSVSSIEQSIEDTIIAIRDKGHNNLYVHIDLDVLDPSEFSSIPVPVAGGLTKDTLLQLLKKLNRDFTILGLGLLEYGPVENKQDQLIEEIVQIGSNL